MHLVLEKLVSFSVILHLGGISFPNFGQVSKIAESLFSRENAVINHDLKVEDCTGFILEGALPAHVVS